VVELLRQAQEWRRQLDSGDVRTQAEIARRERITRARVTQIMALIRLAPEIQERALALPDTIRRPTITERALRPIAQATDHEVQLVLFEKLLSSPEA